MDGRKEDVWHLHIETIHLCKRVEIPKKKIYIYTVYRIKKGKEQHAIKSLFTWLSGLQLQPDPLLPPPSQNLNSFSLFYFHLLMAY